jgi:hypothetical protein
MRKFFTLPIVLSLIWLVLAFSSFYILDFRNTQKIADSFYSSCTEKKSSYPEDVLLEEYCKNDRDKILSEWSDTKFFTPLAFAFGSLFIFWIFGFIFITSI